MNAKQIAVALVDHDVTCMTDEERLQVMERRGYHCEWSQRSAEEHLGVTMSYDQWLDVRDIYEAAMMDRLGGIEAGDESHVYVVDFDTISACFEPAELGDRSTARRAVEEVVVRVEAECERRGLVAVVKAHFGCSGPSRCETDPRVWEAVLVDQAAAIRAAVLES